MTFRGHIPISAAGASSLAVADGDFISEASSLAASGGDFISGDREPARFPRGLSVTRSVTFFKKSLDKCFFACYTNREK